MTRLIDEPLRVQHKVTATPLEQRRAPTVATFVTGGRV
jgi:hypothetical protein